MLERVVTWIPSPMMGDMQVEIRYSDWRDVGNGIKAPYHIHMHQGDHPLVRGMNLMDVQATDVKVNVQNASLTVPDAVRNAPAPKVNIVTTKLADGMWLIGGGSHNSIAVEFKDFAAIIEAPLDDAHPRGDRGNQAAHSGQADQVCRQHPSPLGSCGRLAGGLRGRRHHRHQ